MINHPRGDRGAVAGEGTVVKLYRINKVAEPGGRALKKKDVLAKSDAEAMKRAEELPDCPVCDVLHNGQLVGTVV